jgi:hypothetical protein
MRADSPDSPPCVPDWEAGMRYRIFVGSGFAVGFLAGAWLGRDRYYAAMRRMRGFKDNPSVNTTAGLLHASAGGAVGSAKRVVIGTAVHTIAGRTPVPQADSGTTHHGSVNGARPDPASRLGS